MGKLRKIAAKARRKAEQVKRRRWRIARTHEQIKAMEDEREYAMLSEDGKRHIRMKGKEWKRIAGNEKG